MTEKYGLYVGVLQDIPSYVEFSYYDSVKRRLFLFCDRKPDGKFAPVPSDLWDRLTPDERAWLGESCLAVNRRWIRENEQDAEKTAQAFLDLLEEELKKEAQSAHEDQDGKEADGSGGEEVSV